MSRIEVRKGMPDVQLTRAEFERRFCDRFFDPAFAKNEVAIKAIIDTAWDGYDVYRKNPIKRVAGEGYAKPNGGTSGGMAGHQGGRRCRRGPPEKSQIAQPHSARQWLHALRPELPR